jgi:hypothetical protein
MAVTHRLGSALRFDLYGAAETSAFMSCHGVVTSCYVAVTDAARAGDLSPIAGNGMIGRPCCLT